MIVKTVVRPETEMKNSGIEYIGKIPNDWEVRKVGYLAAKITDYVASGSFATLAQNVQYLDEPDYARLIRTVDLSGSVNKQPVYVSKEAYKFLSNSNLFGGELILPNIGSVGCVYQYKKIYEHATLAPNSILLDMKENNRFYFYWFSNPIVGESLKMLGNSTVQVKFNKSQLRQYMLPRPPLSEQQAIADYLDETCSKIDEIIAEAKASIDEYKELKQSVIFEAVTKGLDKNVEMKDSGVEGMGFIPAKWPVVRFMKVNYVRARLGWKGLKAEEYVDVGYPFLAAYHIVNGHLCWENLNCITKERYDESPEIKLSIGDLVLVKDGAGIGKCARIDDMPLGEATVNSSLSVITPNKLLDYRYEYYYFMSPLFQNIIARLKNGMGVPHLTQESMKDIYLPLPSKNEQQAIADYLDNKMIGLDSLIAEKESLINDLEAYKKSLIYEVVTGKRKVV